MRGVLYTYNRTTGGYHHRRGRWCLGAVCVFCEALIVLGLVRPTHNTTDSTNNASFGLKQPVPEELTHKQTATDIIKRLTHYSCNYLVFTLNYFNPGLLSIVF